MGLLNIGTSMCLKTSKQECGRGPKPGHRGLWPKPSGISNFCSFSPFPCKAFIADVGPILVSGLKRLLCIPGLFGEEAGLSCLAWPFPVPYIHQVASGEKTKCTYRNRCLWVSGHAGHRRQALQKLIVSITAKLNYWHVGCLTTF